MSSHPPLSRYYCCAFLVRYTQRNEAATHVSRPEIVNIMRTATDSVLGAGCKIPVMLRVVRTNALVSCRAGVWVSFAITTWIRSHSRHILMLNLWHFLIIQTLDFWRRYNDGEVLRRPPRDSACVAKQTSLAYLSETFYNVMRKNVSCHH